MRINDDIQDMIAGLAHLGAVYLRISEKVNTFYQENPLLWMEAGSLSKSRGENKGCQDLGEFIEAMVSKSKENPPARHEILFLKRYARKYDDPVLAMETVKEFLGKDRLERIDMIDKLKEQLRLFPDPTLGLSDLREFGYARGDMFPIRKNAAVELLGTGTITVYALSEDGRRDIVDSVAMLFTHRGMYGVLKEDWLSFSIREFKAGREYHFFFRSSTKKLRIYQWKESDPNIHTCAFMPYETLETEGISVDISRYDFVYEEEIPEWATLEDVYERFNLNRPEDFKGHSLSIGDVVAFMEEGIWAYYYVQPFGFKPLDDFVLQKTPEEMPEGASEIATPRIMDKAPLKDTENHPRDEPAEKHRKAR